MWHTEQEDAEQEHKHEWVRTMKTSRPHSMDKKVCSKVTMLILCGSFTSPAEWWYFNSDWYCSNRKSAPCVIAPPPLISSFSCSQRLISAWADLECRRQCQTSSAEQSTSHCVDHRNVIQIQFCLWLIYQTRRLMSWAARRSTNVDT